MSLSRNPDPVTEDNPQILLFHNNNLTQFDNQNMLGASSSFVLLTTSFYKHRRLRSEKTCDIYVSVVYLRLGITPPLITWLQFLVESRYYHQTPVEQSTELACAAKCYTQSADVWTLVTVSWREIYDTRSRFVRVCSAAGVSVTTQTLRQMKESSSVNQRQFNVSSDDFWWSDRKRVGAPSFWDVSSALAVDIQTSFQLQFTDVWRTSCGS